MKNSCPCNYMPDVNIECTNQPGIKSVVITDLQGNVVSVTTEDKVPQFLLRNRMNFPLDDFGKIHWKLAKEEAKTKNNSVQFIINAPGHDQKK